MTDLELLQAAARAAGIAIIPCTCRNERWPFKHDEKVSGKWGHWNPLEDDGDALRLVIALHMGVQVNGADHWQSPNCTIVHYGEQYRLTMPHTAGAAQDTRRAIVRAAAALAGQRDEKREPSE